MPVPDATPLSAESAARVAKERNVGARIAQLRRERDHALQKDLLDKWKELTGKDAPSTTWLSLVETGQLRLSKGKRDDLQKALALTDEDALFLVEDVHPTATDALVHYAAWQSARLAMGEWLCNGKNPDERRRGRAVMTRLGAVLAQDPDIQRVTEGHPLALEQFTDLPTLTRWMLVLEAAYMNPFAPYEPFDTNWDFKRIEALDDVAVRLGLDAVDPQIKLIEDIRVPGFIGWLNGKEPQDAHSAAADVTDAEDFRALLSGHGLVGWLGWEFACGTFLTRVTPDSETAVATNDEGEPLPVPCHIDWAGLMGDTIPDALVAGSLIGAPVTAAFLTALADGRVARMSRKDDAVSALTDDPRMTRIDVGSFLLKLGSQVARLEFAKLITLIQILHDAPDVGLDSLDTRLPSTGEVREQFAWLAAAVTNTREGRVGLDKPKSLVMKNLEGLADDIQDYRKKLPK